MKLITDENEIKECQMRFINSLLKSPVEKIPCRLNFPQSNRPADERWKTWDGTKYKLDNGAKGDTEVWWSSERKMWMSFRLDKSIKTEKWRYWNAFGLEKPLPNTKTPIIVEINFPVAGENRRIAGSFVKNEQGHVSVIHNGRLTVGNRKINLCDYKNSNKFNFHFIESDILIGELDEPSFSMKIYNFVKEVNKAREYFRLNR